MELIALGILILLGIFITLIILVKKVFGVFTKKKVEPEPKQQSDAWVNMFKAANGNPEMEKALAELLKQHLK